MNLELRLEWEVVFLLHGTKKKVILIGVVCIGVICGVLAFNLFRYFREMSLQFEDKNGAENKQLCLITDELIRKNTEDYRMIRKHVVLKEKNTTGVQGEWSNMDNNYTEIEVGMLSGIYVCNVCLGNGNSITYKINAEINKGNFRMVVTDEQNEILYDIPYDQEYEFSFLTEVDKLYYVKLIGESANISIQLKRIPE